MIRRALVVLAATGCVACAGAVAPAPASASLVSAGCGVVGLFSGLAGKACNVVTGPAGGIVKKILGGGSAASHVARAAGLVAVGAWALGGAKFALDSITKVIADTTSPQLRSTWFSSTYWRMTAIAALLTLPFLFAAAVQALMRSDLPQLVRSAGFLPVAALATAIAAPVTMLLLAASDEMSSIVSSAAGSSGGHLLRGAGLIAGFISVIHGSPFLVFVVSLIATAGALALWLELAIRQAAVYIVVLMLPLAFAAMVWPARRVWAVRSIELLVALILSKFAIVAVLTLGTSALAQLGHGGFAAALSGIALLILSVFAPWALLRLLPLSELASGVAAPLGQHVRDHGTRGMRKLSDEGTAAVLSETVKEWPGAISTFMRGQAAEAEGHGDGGGSGSDAAPAGRIFDQQAMPEFQGGGATPGPTTGSSSAADPARTAASTGAGGSANGHAGGDDAATVHDGNVNGDASRNGERLPGLGLIWQADDFEHRPITLGKDGFAEPLEPVWPLEPLDAEPSEGEDGDPLPEPQPPADGDR